MKMRFIFLIQTSVVAFVSFAPIDSLYADNDGCAATNRVPASEYCLAGTTIIGKKGIAVFKNKNESRSIETGETIDNWRVVDVSVAGVTIGRGAEIRHLGVKQLSATSSTLKHKTASTTMYNVSPLNAGNAKSIGTTGPGLKLSISTHLPPVKDY